MIYFVVGIPRSGTTYMTQLISSHPEVEQVLLSDFDPSISVKEGDLLSYGETNFVSRPDREIKRVLDEKHEKYGNIVEKTPLHLLQAPRIKGLFPDSQMIYVQRNPLGTINSMMKSKVPNFLQGLTIKQLCTHYEAWFEFFQSYREMGFIDALALYDLSDTKEAVRGMFEELSLDSQYSGDIFEICYRKPAVVNALRNGRADNYRNELTEAEHLEITNLIGDIIEWTKRKQEKKIGLLKLN